MATDPDDVKPPPAIAVPTTFGAEVTLPPGGTVELAFPLGQDFLLEGIDFQTPAPAILRVQVSEAPGPQASTASGPGESFHQYLERELPFHLAKLAGDELEDWRKKNEVLHQAAVSGDDEAFFELLARDPRQFGSDLVLGRILTWRTWIDTYNRFFRFKLSRLYASHEAVGGAREQMERAHKNLARLGESQLRLYDQRGKRPLPPTAHVRGSYYALLCLFQGLRTIYRDQKKAGAHPRQMETTLLDFVRELAGLRPSVSAFLPWVQVALRLIRDPELLAQAGFTDATLSELVGPGHATPSDTARELTAAAFEVSTDTVERLAAQPVAIPLPSSDKEYLFLSGPLVYDLLEFPEVKPVLDGLTR